MRFAKLFAAIALLAAVWALSFIRNGATRTWVHPSGRPGPVRILRFYASVGAVLPGERATLCYGVENAKTVRISPLLPGIFPSPSHCLEVFPEHTTHYTILAEGYDGVVATRSLTLPVETSAPPRQVLHFAVWEREVHYNLGFTGVHGLWRVRRLSLTT